MKYVYAIAGAIALLIFLGFPCPSKAESFKLPKPELIQLDQLPPLLFPDSFDESTQNAWESRLIIIRDNTDKIVPEVTLQIRGTGGNVSIVATTMRLIEAIRARGVVVHAQVIGQAMSGHAYVVCAATDVQMLDHTTLYFHSGYALNSLKILGEVFIWKESPRTIKSSQDMQYMYESCIKAGILTVKDLQRLDAGYDITITQYKTMRVKSFSREDIVSLSLGNIQILIEGLLSLIIIMLVSRSIKRMK